MYANPFYDSDEVGTLLLVIPGMLLLLWLSFQGARDTRRRTKAEGIRYAVCERCEVELFAPDAATLAKLIEAHANFCVCDDGRAA